MNETTVTEQLNALIAEYGSERDALNHTLAKLEAAQDEIETLKAQLYRAELARDGWTPVSEPPLSGQRGSSQRDVKVKTEDGEIFSAWRGDTTGRWYAFENANGKRYPEIEITPVAWKELE